MYLLYKLYYQPVRCARVCTCHSQVTSYIDFVPRDSLQGQNLIVYLTITNMLIYFSIIILVPHNNVMAKLMFHSPVR